MSSFLCWWQLWPNNASYLLTGGDLAVVGCVRGRFVSTLFFFLFPPWVCLFSGIFHWHIPLIFNFGTISQDSCKQRILLTSRMNPHVQRGWRDREALVSACDDGRGKKMLSWETEVTVKGMVSIFSTFLYWKAKNVSFLTWSSFILKVDTVLGKPISLRCH